MPSALTNTAPAPFIHGNKRHGIQVLPVGLGSAVCGALGSKLWGKLEPACAYIVYLKGFGMTLEYGVACGEAGVMVMIEGLLAGHIGVADQV